MRKAIFGSCLAIALTVSAPLSQAVVYELQTNAIIREVLLPVGDLSDGNQAVVNEWGLGVGAIVSSVYLIDGDAPPTVVIDMGFESVVYDAVLQADAILPNASLSMSSSDPDYSVRDSFGPQQTDSVGVTVFQTINTSVGDVFVSLNSQLYATSGQAISDSDLNPVDFVDLSLWDAFNDGPRTLLSLNLTFENGDRVGFWSEYTSNTVRVVPVPGAGLLLLGALAGLTSLRRR